MRHVKHISTLGPTPEEEFEQEARFGGGASYRSSNKMSQHGRSEAVSPEKDDIRVISQQIMDKKAFVWAFGENKDGEIGIGSQRDAFLPRPIFGQLKDGQSAKSISSASHHSAIVSKSGDVYVCGSHLHGKLGI